jgi:hypothetical protein
MFSVGLAQGANERVAVLAADLASFVAMTLLEAWLCHGETPTSDCEI